MSKNRLEHNGLVWINVTNPTEKQLQEISKEYGFHDLDVKDCVSVAQSPKLDIYKNYLFLVLHFPEYDKKTNGIVTKELDIFIGKKYLVTVHKGEFDALEGFWDYCKKNKEAREQYMNKSSGFLLYNILSPIYRKAFSVVDRIGESIQAVESEMYSGETKDVVKDIALARRDLLKVKMIIDPQRFLFNSLVNLKRDFLGYESEVYFDDIHDIIERAWILLTSYREVIIGLHDTNESLISHKINEVMKVLTIISVSLLPLTLLAGIYGMNIAGLPFAGHPSGLWLVIALMVAIIFGILIFFRKKDWI